MVYEFTILQPVLFHRIHCLMCFSMNDYMVVSMLAWQYFQIAFCLLEVGGILKGWDFFSEFLHEISYFIMMELLFLLWFFLK